MFTNLGRDEYKEFEKLIQEDLQEVDNRMEEEEVSLYPAHIFINWTSLPFGLQIEQFYHWHIIALQFDAAEMIEEEETVEQR